MADEALEIIDPSAAADGEGSTSLVPAGTQEVELEQQEPEVGADGKPVVPAIAAAAADDVNVDLIPVDDLSIKSLRGYLQKHPELAKLDKDVPGLHNWLYANARRSALLEDYRCVYATPESAKDALQAANDMLDLEADYLDPQTASPQKMLNRLWEMSLVRNDQGQVTGSTGAFEALVGQLRTDIFGQIEEHCKKNNDATGLEAISHIRSLFGGPKPQGQQSASALSDPDKQELENLRAEKRDRGSQERQQFFVQLSESVDGVTNEEAKSIMKNISDTNKLALNDYQKSLIVNDAVKQLAKRASEDPSYANTFKQLLRKGHNRTTTAEITKHVRQYANRHLQSLIAKGIEQMSGTVIAAAASRSAKQAEQRGRANVRGTGSVASPVSPSLQERLAERQKNIGKRRISDLEVMEEVLNSEE